MEPCCPATILYSLAARGKGVGLRLQACRLTSSALRAPSGDELVACVRPTFSPADDCRREGWSCWNKPSNHIALRSAKLSKLVLKTCMHAAFNQKHFNSCFKRLPL